MRSKDRDLDASSIASSFSFFHKTGLRQVRAHIDHVVQGATASFVYATHFPSFLTPLISFTGSRKVAVHEFVLEFHLSCCRFIVCIVTSVVTPLNFENGNDRRCNVHAASAMKDLLAMAVTREAFVTFTAAMGKDCARFWDIVSILGLVVISIRIWSGFCCHTGVDDLP